MLSPPRPLTRRALPGGGPDAPGARAAGRVAARGADRLGRGAPPRRARSARRGALEAGRGRAGRTTTPARRSGASAPGAGSAGWPRRGATRDFVGRALELAACAAGTSCDLRALAPATRTFVTEFARIADPLDGAALAGLQTLLEELELLSPAALSPAEAAARLADAVRGLSVESDRARPGRIHVTDVGSGGLLRPPARLPRRTRRGDATRARTSRIRSSSTRSAARSTGRSRPPRSLCSGTGPRDAGRALEACVARFAGERRRSATRAGSCAASTSRASSSRPRSSSRSTARRAGHPARTTRSSPTRCRPSRGIRARLRTPRWTRPSGGSRR